MPSMSLSLPSNFSPFGRPIPPPRPLLLKTPPPKPKGAPLARATCRTLITAMQSPLPQQATADRCLLLQLCGSEEKIGDW
mmetsp:Transcript_32815/g.84749  ORF Transcript_32815/g.84749 Transcript_32815/m.84749 type:complete len:80 (+) Transcript_32815:2860-3099(+)